MPDFSDSTRKRLAHLAGYHCSFSGCNTFTGGPAPAAGMYSTNLGQAAHIRGARQNSARWDANMSDAQRADISNGIWLCLEHARQVDLNQGKAFPEGLLKIYKSNHETKMRLFQEGLPVASGAITKIRVSGSIPFANTIDLTFGKSNIIAGANMTGKTTLIEFILAFGDFENEYLPRVIAKAPQGSAELEFFFKKATNFKLQINNKSLQYFEDSTPVGTYPKLFNFLYFAEKKISTGRNFWRDFSKVYNIPRKQAKAFVNEVSLSKLRFTEKIKIVRGKVHVLEKGDRSFFSLGSLGGGGFQMFLLDCALYQAKKFSEKSPTILIMDQLFFSFLDAMSTNILLEELRKLPCQTFVVFYNILRCVDFSKFEGWEFYSQSGQRGKADNLVQPLDVART